MSTPVTTDDNLRIVVDGNEYRIIDAANNIDERVLIASVTGGIFVNGNGGNDRLTLDYSGGNIGAPVTFDGGAGSDDLVITNGAFSTVIHNHTNGSDGTINLDGAGAVEITYTGLEPVDMTGSTATNFVFNLPSGDDNAELLDLGGGNLRLRSTDTIPTFEQTDFAAPSGSITINGGGGEDVVVLPDALALNGALTIDSEDIHLGNNITAGGAVLFDGITRIGASLIIDTSAANGDITFDGTVLATGAGGQDLTLNAGTGGDIAFNDAVTRGATAAVGGTIVVEAEHYTSRIARSNGTSWDLVPDENGPFPATFANARGGEYVQALPNGGGTDGPTNAPSVLYEVEITTTGTYRLFPRWTGYDGGSDSFFMDIVELKDGTGGTIADWYEFAGGSGDVGNNSSFAWSTTGGFEQNNAGASPRTTATWDITTPGTYTVRASLREDGVALDAFVLQLDSLAAPTGSGPAESALGARLGTVQIVNANDVDAATFFDAEAFHQIDVQGTTTFAGDVTVDDFIVQEGNVDVNNDLTVTGDTRIGLTNADGGGNANVTVTGGAVSLGDGDGVLDVGRRDTGNTTATNAVLDLSQATSVNIDVADVRMGTRSATAGNVNSIHHGDLFLSEAGTNNITADTILMGEVPGGGGYTTSYTNELVLGDGANNVSVDTWSIGGPKSNGEVRFAGANTSGTGAQGATETVALPGFDNAPAADPDTQTLVSITRDGVTYTNITGATAATATGGNTFGAQNDGAPATANDALTGLIISNGMTNVASSDYTLGVTVNAGDDTGFFFGEINTPGQLGDAVTVIPLDGSGNAIGTWSLSITADDYGTQGGLMDATVTDIHTRLTSFLLSDFTGGAGILTGVAGLRLVDNVGGVDFDPNVVGTFTGVTATSLNLSGKSGATADLIVGDNSANTGANVSGTLDLSGGYFNATIDELTIGRHNTLTGSSDGNLVMDGGNVTIDTITFATDGGTNPQNTSGILTQNGGAIHVANGISDGAGVSTLNVRGGEFHVLGGNVTLDNLNVDNGEFTVDAGDLTVDNMRVGVNGGTATATVSGGDVTVGDGDGDFHIGRRFSGSGATTGTVDFGDANTVAIDVDNVRIGTDTTGSGATEGSLTLSQAGNNALTATNLEIGRTNTGDNQGNFSSLHLGGAANDFNVNTMTVGDIKSAGRVDIVVGGTFTLSGDSNAETDLRVGYNFTGTGTNPQQSRLDLTGGTFNGTLDQVFIARHDTGSGSGKGSLTFESGTVTANRITVADSNGSNPTNTQGTVSFDGDVLDLQGGDIVTDRGVPTFLFTDGLLTDVNIFGFDLHQQGGTLQVGDGNAIDLMTVNGDFETDAGSTLEINLDGPAGPGVAGGHDQLIVNGAVTLNGSDLNLILGGAFVAPAAGTEIVLINNDGSDAVIGEFNGLPEGYIITLAIPNPGTPPPAQVPGQLFEVSYTGGDGNDVVLRTLAETATTNIWLDGTTLVIEDIDGASSNDNLTLRLDGSELVITDPNNALGTLINGAEQPSVNEVRVDVSLFTDVRVDTLAGNDLVTVEDIMSLAGNLTINTGAGLDKIFHSGQVELTGSGAAEYNAEQVEIYTGARLATDSGGITLNGTGGGGSFSGSGVFIAPADIESVSGNIVITGQGGDTGIGNVGVTILIDTPDSAIGKITTGGTISITGTGGSAGAYAHGIEINGGRISSSSSDATAISLIGNGGAGGNGDYSNSGITTFHSEITADNGGVMIEGNGGSGTTSSFNAGVSLYATTVSGTTLDIDGQGGDGLSNNRGIFLSSGSDLDATAGDATLTGVGGGGGSYNDGIYIEGSSVDATGLLTLDGTASTSGTNSFSNSGVHIYNSTTTGGTGLDIDGTGGTGSGGYNYGVNIYNSTATGGTGPVTIDGSANSGTAGYYNVGVSIQYGTVSGSTVDIVGLGGGGSWYNRGVMTVGGSLTSTAGDLDIDGTSANNNSGGYNDGVYMQSTTTTATGLLTIDGSGSTGGANSTSNNGVYLYGGTADGAGGVQITGNGGTGSSGYNYGAYIYFVTSINGGSNAVTITGTANSGTAGYYNVGAGVQYSTITGSAVTVTGTGGGGTFYNRGVLMTGGSITASTGDARVIGMTNNSTSGAYNEGVNASGTTISATTGAVLIQGDGSTSGSNTNNNHGVYLTSVTASGGASTTVTGNGGTGSGGYNTGVTIYYGTIGLATSATTITGTANAGSAGTFNAGTNLQYATVLGSTLNLNGVGGGGGGNNVGVKILGGSATAQSGALTIIGSSNSTAGSLNNGVDIQNATVGGSASTSITGTGGGGLDYNHGIFMNGITTFGVTPFATTPNAGAGTNSEDEAGDFFPQ